jgi:hypothetical protein
LPFNSLLNRKIIIFYPYSAKIYPLNNMEDGFGNRLDGSKFLINGMLELVSIKPDF